MRTGPGLRLAGFISHPVLRQPIPSIRTVPSGDRRHRELLAQATVEVPGLRPAIVSRALRSDLEEMLALRHFLRHGYDSDLDADRLAIQADRLGTILPIVNQGLDRFVTFLEGSLGATRG